MLSLELAILLPLNGKQEFTYWAYKTEVQYLKVYPRASGTCKPASMGNSHPGAIVLKRHNNLYWGRGGTAWWNIGKDVEWELSKAATKWELNEMIKIYRKNVQMAHTTPDLSIMCNLFQFTLRKHYIYNLTFFIIFSMCYFSVLSNNAQRPKCIWSLFSVNYQ